MKVARVGLIWLLLAVFCAANQGSSADLERKADEASSKDCARLSMQTARQLVEDANQFFGAGDAKAAHNAVDGSLHYVRRAVDCSVEARKGEKAAEIDLRKLIRRMKDVMQTVDSDDRPHLSRTLTELEKQQDSLLHAMFGAAAGGASPEKKP